MMYSTCNYLVAGSLSPADRVFPDIIYYISFKVNRGTLCYKYCAKNKKRWVKKMIKIFVARNPADSYLNVCPALPSPLPKVPPRTRLPCIAVGYKNSF